MLVDPSKDIDSRRDPTIPSNFSLLVLCRAPSIDLIKINAEFEYNSTYQFKEKRNEHNEIFLIMIISNI